MSIDYEKEVKRTYDGADVKPVMAFGITFKYFIEDLYTGQRISRSRFEQNEAWEDAYWSLKQKNKI